MVVATGVNGLQKVEIIENGELLQPPAIQEAKVMVISLGFEPDSFEEEIKGYGFLIPDRENRFIMGSLYSSRLFDFKTPEDKVMLRCFVGGIRHQDRLELPEDEIIAKVISDLDDYLGIKSSQPLNTLCCIKIEEFLSFLLDHDRFLDWREERNKNNHRTFFTGIGWKGIACDVLAEESIELAQNLIDLNLTEMAHNDNIETISI